MQPDFNRIVNAVHHEEPDRVPLVKVLIDTRIQSQFLGRPVGEDDFEAFPWDVAAKLDLSMFRRVQRFLPSGMTH